MRLHDARYFALVFQIVLLAGSKLIFAVNKEPGVTVLVSGETHGMASSCDCPTDPGGGLPKRLTLVESIRKQGPVLLLDAGGFSAGGLYDTYTEGRLADSIRTIAVLKGMGKIGYDAVALGDEELQWEKDWFSSMTSACGVPIVCANVRYKKGHVTFPRYLFVTRGGVRFGITSVVTQERLLGMGSDIVVDDPLQAIKSVWDTLARSSDVRIIIAHCGEEAVSTIADTFPDCQILVNGHRKGSTVPVQVVNSRQVVMQFGFQGKRLSLLPVRIHDKTADPANGRWIDVLPSVPDNIQLASQIDQLIEPSKIQKRNILDLYIMAKCPYGKAALAEVLKLYEAGMPFDLSLWFIGDVLSDGNLKSLQGQGEIMEEMQWLSVRACYPDLWILFLHIIGIAGRSTEEAIKELGLNNSKLQSWIDDSGRGVLREHYQRTMRLQVEASPTIFLNNNLFTKDPTKLRIARQLCSFGGGIRVICDSLPQCFDNGDCRKNGAIGICRTDTAIGMEGGVCTFTDDVAFQFTVLLADSQRFHPETEVIKVTKELFPAAQIRTLFLSAEEGKQIQKTIKPAALPLYLFDKKVKDAIRYSDVSSGLREAGKWLTFRDGVVPGSYFYKRKKMAGAMTLFIQTNFKERTEVGYVLASLSDTMLVNLDVVPVAGQSGKVGSIADSKDEDSQARNEAMNWIKIKSILGKSSFIRYLKTCPCDADSLSSVSCMRSVGFDPKEKAAASRKDNKEFKRIQEMITELNISGPVVMLLDNREIISIRNAAHLSAILSEIRETGY